MSKKVDYVGNTIYAEFLNGGRYRNNETRNDSVRMRRMYMRILTELATNRFKWTGLPETVDIRYMELQLFYNALSVFYYDHEYNSYFALQGSPVGRVNMLDQPTAFRVTGNNFIGKTLSALNRQMIVGGELQKEQAECVPIWANYLRRPDLDIVTIYSNKLAEFDRTIEINGLNARMPKIISVGENSRLTADQINRQIDEGNNVIKVDSNMGTELMPTVLDMGVDPDTIEKMHIIRTRLWNECMGLLGINNSNQDKKERLVADEVAANDEQTGSMKDVNLNARKTAARQISARYGLQVEVEYNTDIDTQLPSMFPVGV